MYDTSKPVAKLCLGRIYDSPKAWIDWLFEIKKFTNLVVDCKVINLLTIVILY